MAFGIQMITWLSTNVTSAMLVTVGGMFFRASDRFLLRMVGDNFYKLWILQTCESTQIVATLHARSPQTRGSAGLSPF